MILTPPEMGGNMRTVLRFCATHVMSFIGGTIAAHLYHHFAKQNRAIKFDMIGAKRHAGALEAETKYV